MWEGGCVHLKSDLGDSAERFAMTNDLLNNFIWISDNQGSSGPS